MESEKKERKEKKEGKEDLEDEKKMTKKKEKAEEKKEVKKEKEDELDEQDDGDKDNHSSDTIPFNEFSESPTKNERPTQTSSSLTSVIDWNGPCAEKGRDNQSRNPQKTPMTNGLLRSS